MSKKPSFKFHIRLNNLPLKPVLITGFVLTVILSWSLVISAISWRDNPRMNPGPVDLSFRQELQSYDLYDAPRRVLDGENPAQIERLLDSLQNKAISVEENLSVLKRRRALAMLDRRYIETYERAASEISMIFPHSAPLAAVAAEALLMNAPLRGENLDLLRHYASNISQPRFSLLELGLRILAGELDTPDEAFAIPWLPQLLSQDLSEIPGYIRDNLLVNEFLLLTYQDDIFGATYRLNSLLSPESLPPDELIRMGAVFNYDHGNLLQAAELFSNLEGENDLAFAASALTMAGGSGARNIWLVLASSREVSSIIYSRSLYNLASSALNPEEAALWLERLLAQHEGAWDITRIFGILRYTRTLGPPRNIAILEEEEMRQIPLLDLELLRLQIDSFPQIRAEAEIWNLLNRHPLDELLHEWAVWYFDHQRRFSETAMVLTRASRNNMAGTWIDLHRGLTLIREGNMNEGEAVLMELERRSRDWRVSANLGRIQESRRAISAALAHYENAARLVTDDKAAAQIQLRISRCLEALGRSAESRRALQHALELDPDNPLIHREARDR